ncbi:MAG: hypothetical protein N2320_04960, partial [Candidatus Bipolaricaulota bacterium]|nr:hypothetical protein [Candidatus Bipolaricaulota bacterium]
MSFYREGWAVLVAREFPSQSLSGVGMGFYPWRVVMSHIVDVWSQSLSGVGMGFYIPDHVR